MIFIHFRVLFLNNRKHLAVHFTSVIPFNQVLVCLNTLVSNNSRISSLKIKLSNKMIFSHHGNYSVCLINRFISLTQSLYLFQKSLVSLVITCQ